jgi:Transposase DDE domain
MRRKIAKAKYRLRNWQAYNAALLKRRSLTLWVSEEALSAWYDEVRTGRPGAPRTYSVAITCMAVLAVVYRLTLRVTQGLIASVLQLLKVALPVPDYTTLCRRRRQLAVSLSRRAKDELLHLVFDVAGIKVHGEGERKVRSHGRLQWCTWSSCTWESMKPATSLWRRPQ